jgi:thiosulfate/3-mercaptopyruvate sulfurtransferase
MSGYAHPEVLVSTDWVKENLGKPGIKLIEVDVDTKAYEAGHIPGAIGFNWQTQLQDGVRRDIIGKEEFETLLSQSGVSSGDTIVLYGDNNNWFACYAFWLFKMYGHKDVRLMNGGRPATPPRRPTSRCARRSRTCSRHSTRRTRTSWTFAPPTSSPER